MNIRVHPFIKLSVQLQKCHSSQLRFLHVTLYIDLLPNSESTPDDGIKLDLLPKKAKVLWFQRSNLRVVCQSHS